MLLGADRIGGTEKEEINSLFTDWNKEHLIMMKCIDSVDALRHTETLQEKDSGLPLYTHKNSFDYPSRGCVWIFHDVSKIIALFQKQSAQAQMTIDPRLLSPL